MDGPSSEIHLHKTQPSSCAEPVQSLQEAGEHQGRDVPPSATSSKSFVLCSRAVAKHLACSRDIPWLLRAVQGGGHSSGPTLSHVGSPAALAQMLTL